MARSTAVIDRVYALSMGLRAAQLLAFQLLSGVRDQFPATVQALMSRPQPVLDVHRDAQASPDDTLSLVNILDLLSAEQLLCISPEMHRGWQDKKQSCREARQISREAAGFSLDSLDRAGLLAAVALRNRLLRMPPPAIVDPETVRSTLESVFGLVMRLVPASALSSFPDLRRLLDGGGE